MRTKKKKMKAMSHLKRFMTNNQINVEDQCKIKCDGFDTNSRSVKLNCFSIDMYHTAFLMLINGKKHDMFMDDHQLYGKFPDGKPVKLDNLNKCLR